MPIVRWSPSVPLSRREHFLVGRMARTGKLFAFLRKNRHELFDDAFQSELEAMYRDSGEGKQPVSPALLAMVILLQAYTKERPPASRRGREPRGNPPPRSRDCRIIIGKTNCLSL